MRRHVRPLADVGVDRVLLMHQGGRMRHDRDCASIEFFAREVMPECEAATVRKASFIPEGAGARVGIGAETRGALGLDVTAAE